MRALPRLLAAGALFTLAIVAGDEPYRVDGEHDAAIVDAVRDAILHRQLLKMRESGVAHVPADALPATVREALGLRDGELVPVERFYDPAFQEAMAQHGIAEAFPPEVYEPSVEVLADPDVLAAVRAAFGPRTEIVATPEVMRALNDHPSDHAKLREAVERSIDDLPRDLREELTRGFRVHGEGPQHPPGSLPFERLPTSEVLAKLDEGSRAALAPHRDLLDDHWALMDAMPSMSERDRAAASKFISRMRKPTPPPADSDYAKAVRRWREQGYRDAPGAPRGTALLASIEAGMLSAREAAAGDEPPTAPARFDGSEEWDDSLAPVPDALIAAGSRTHVLVEETGRATTTGAVRLFTRSVFDDALLLVQESDADAFYPRDPNLTIAGHPANVAWALFENGAWTTTVAGYDGRRVHHVTVEKKLDGAEGSVRSLRLGHHRGGGAAAVRRLRASRPHVASQPPLGAASARTWSATRSGRCMGMKCVSSGR